MNRKRKSVSIALCAVVLLTLLFSFCFIAVEAGHDCVGEDCNICLEINSCLITLRALGALILSLMPLCAMLFSLSALFFAVINSFTIKTPVTLKVKLIS